MKILVVVPEQHADLLTFLVPSLEKSGNEVWVVKNSDEAAKIMDAHDDLSLIITELHLEKANDGIKVVEKGSERKTPTILTSGSFDRDVTEIALQLEAQVLSKMDLDHHLKKQGFIRKRK